jgi:branched-chain amino acid transport system permease protein
MLVPFERAPLLFSLLSAAALALAAGAIAGGLAERYVFRPLHGVATQAPLVASIGLVIFLQEYLRILFGADNYWIGQVLNQPQQLALQAGFQLSVTPLQVLIVLLTGIWFSALLLLLRYTRFGRNHRACAEDANMAALCGIDVRRVIQLTFVIGTLGAGGAGFIMAVYYGVVNFYMGFSYGLKALTAAIIGGIGSLPGAILGGLLIALLETLWSAYLSIQYRDIAVFGLLIVMLVLRPAGLLGQERHARPDHSR